MRKKTWLAILAAAFMLCALLPVAALAADGDTFVENGIKYKVVSEAEKTVEIYHPEHDDVGSEYPLKNSTYSGEITIPATINGYTVVGVGNCAFFCSGATKVVLPDTLKYIQMNAFSYESAAPNKSLREINIPSGVTSIGESAFAYCENLSSLKLPSGIESGLVQALRNYPNLAQVSIADGGKYFIEAGLLYEGTSLIKQMERSLTKVNIKEGTTTIAAGVFDNNPTITTVVMPNTVTAIEVMAFNNCKKLTDVIWSTNLHSIGIRAFCNSGITKANLSSVKTIEESAFFGCKDLADITWSTQLTTFKEAAFQDCTSLTKVDLPEGISTIPPYAFCGCTALQTITLPEGLTSIGEGAFLLIDDDLKNENPMLEYINIPSTVEQIGPNFLGGLKPDGGTKIISQVANPNVFTDDALAGLVELGDKPVILYPAEAEAAYRASGLSTYLPSPGSPDEDQTAYALNIPATLSLDVNQSTSLTAACKVPQGTRLVVSLSDPTVVSIDLNGTITGIKSGSATVTVSIATSGGITLDTKTCTVTVNHVHAPAKTEAAAPTCAQNGHAAYWYCADCQKYFADAACTREIALADTVIPATGAHQYQNGLCTVCGARDTSTPPAAQPPKTGDDSRLALWTLLLIAAAIGLAGAALYRKGKATR